MSLSVSPRRGQFYISRSVTKNKKGICSKSWRVNGAPSLCLNDTGH